MRVRVSTAASKTKNVAGQCFRKPQQGWQLDHGGDQSKTAGTPQVRWLRGVATVSAGEYYEASEIRRSCCGMPLPALTSPKSRSILRKTYIDKPIYQRTPPRMWKEMRRTIQTTRRLCPRPSSVRSQAVANHPISSRDLSNWHAVLVPQLLLQLSWPLPLQLLHCIIRTAALHSRSGGLLKL